MSEQERENYTSESDSTPPQKTNKVLGTEEPNKSTEVGKASGSKRAKASQRTKRAKDGQSTKRPKVSKEQRRTTRQSLPSGYVWLPTDEDGKPLIKSAKPTTKSNNRTATKRGSKKDEAPNVADVETEAPNGQRTERRKRISQRALDTFAEDIRNKKIVQYKEDMVSQMTPVKIETGTPTADDGEVDTELIKRIRQHKYDHTLFVGNYNSPYGRMIVGIWRSQLVITHFVNEEEIELRKWVNHIAIDAIGKHSWATEWIDGELHQMLPENAELQKSLFAQAVTELDEYFAGKRQEFAVPTLMIGTSLEKDVWENIGQVPYGTTVSYADINSKLKTKRYVRSVARICSLNPLQIVIPCHRVISSDGRLSGYAGGLELKQKILALEQSILNV